VAVRSALLDIADTHIAGAADLLRAHTGENQAGRLSPASAARVVNAAARDLVNLVLLRGIHSAQEVYAREARMLAQAQATLRWHTASNASVDAAATTATQQDELAQWTDQLTTELQDGMRYDRRPLAVLRLIRSVKDLRESGASDTMRQASSLIQQGQADQANAMQAGLVRTLLNAEFSVRLSGAYSTLLNTRDQIRRLSQSQLALHEQTQTLTDQALTGQAIRAEQTALRRQLLTLMLPSIPAPRAQLFDRALPSVPPVERLLAGADQAMASAISQLAQGERQAVARQQQQAAQALAQLTEIVDRWSVEMGLQSQGLGTLVAASSERLSRIAEFEARVIDLLEKTDTAAMQEKKTQDLAEPQLILSEDLADFYADIARQHAADRDPDLPPLLGHLKQAEGAANAAVQSLKDSKADQAIEQQEQVADALARAGAVALGQSERLDYLQGLLLFQRSVGLASGYMADIVAEQRDLLEATQDIKPADVPPLLPVFNNLRQCMFDVAPLLELVAGRLDVGTPLVFAQTDFEDAVFSLQAGDNLNAFDAQDVAAESLAEVQSRVEHIQLQTAYVAEIVALLHATTSDTALLQHQQAELMHKAAAADSDRLRPLAADQVSLLERAARLDQLINAAAGNPKIVVPADPTDFLAQPAGPTPVFTAVAEPMRDVAEQLNAGDAAAADQSMQDAAAALSNNADALLTVIEMLHGLPSIEITTLTEPALVRLIDVLVLASDQRLLSRTTYGSDAEAISGVADQQNQLASRCRELAQAGEPNPLLNAAEKHQADAAAALQAADRDLLLQHQQAADEQLRHFIVEQAVILETSIPPPSASDAPAAEGPGSDSESAVSAGFIADFVSGEAPDDQRSEWKVLGERNRAALNQNFARELPLEYRGLLKDYYERVAE